MNRDLDRVIKDVHHRIVDAEATASERQQQRPNNTELQQQFRIGKLAHEYRLDRRDLEYPDNLSQEEIDQRLQRIQQFEDMKAIAYQNAIAAGASTEEVDQFTAEVEEQYAHWLQAELKNVQTVIHNDGTMTVTNTRTNESAKFSNDGTPIE
ncbi:MAG TPA: hypothetical protein VGE97_00895 [Nitrososphaera sp.]|jgi:hypothetical protein